MSRVLIIGGGVVGAAIAYELSGVAGLSTTLLDRERPASGATKAALGILMGVISQKTKGRAWQLRQLSLQRYETLVPELEALTGQAIAYNRCGILSLQMAGKTDQEQWQHPIAARREQGWPLEWWERERVAAACPQLQLDRTVGAVYSPRDRQVDPLSLTEALVAGAQLRGVECFWEAEVSKIETLGDGSYRVVTSVGDLSADWIAIAAGLGSSSLVANLGIASPQPKLQLRPVLGQALRLQFPTPQLAGAWQPVLDADDVHLVPLSDRECWLGATVEFPDDTGEVRADESLLARLLTEATTWYPALAQATVVNSWSGRRPRPEGQSAPVIGPLPGCDRIILATGHYRNGILLAPATAIQVREAIVNSLLLADVSWRSSSIARRDPSRLDRSPSAEPPTPS